MKSRFLLPPAKSRSVYLDHAAATPLDPRVRRAMAPYWEAEYANPGALYALGQTARTAIDQARASIAEVLFTQPDSIIFTSGGTEANNLAFFGLRSMLHKKHVITTAVEHASVLAPLRELEKSGVEVTYLGVNSQGEIDVAELVKTIRPETRLVSVMYANNEIGTVNPVAEIGRELLKYRQKNKTQFPYFHTDACQAAGALELHTERLHVDLLTLNGSKIYGPKGVGMLYVRRGVPLAPQIVGGGQQQGWRSGTENVPGIVGLARALTLTQGNREKEATRQAKLRDYFWHEMQAAIPDVCLNGPALDRTRLPNNLNVRFAGVEGETLVLYLDAYGIMAATGSACAADAGEASHVLVACGLRPDEAADSVRYTLGAATTRRDLDYVLKYLPKVIADLRALPQ